MCSDLTWHRNVPCVIHRIWPGVVYLLQTILTVQMLTAGETSWLWGMIKFFVFSEFGCWRSSGFEIFKPQISIAPYWKIHLVAKWPCCVHTQVSITTLASQCEFILIYTYYIHIFMHCTLQEKRIISSLKTFQQPLHVLKIFSLKYITGLIVMLMPKNDIYGKPCSGHHENCHFISHWLQVFDIKAALSTTAK